MLERFLPGHSAAILSLRSSVALFNTSRNTSLAKTILITGESGAGKNHLARVLAAHRFYQTTEQSPLGPGDTLSPYLAEYDEIHLPALPDALVESELFGHKRGAFTGADKDKIGLLSDRAEPARYDILLDEIGDASPDMQAKILQVIERGTFRPLGAEAGDEEQTSARLLLATNKDLACEVAEGRFREDLFWRLRTFELAVVPLRFQRENIRELIVALLAELEAGLPLASAESQPVPTEADMEWAEKYAWPGNVRQLRALLQLWLLHGGAKSFRQLGALRALPNLKRDPGNHGLHGQLAAGASFGSLDSMLRGRTEMDKETIINWYDAIKPTDDQLSRMFSAMKPQSVRQKVSDWRRQLCRN